MAIEGKITPVKRGDTVCILQDMRHGLKAINDLTLIETQTGSDLLEDDVELFDWKSRYKVWLELSDNQIRLNILHKIQYYKRQGLL